MANKQEEYISLAENILTLIGEENNIDSVTHCVTRLRFYLKDPTKADKDALEELSGVMGVVEANGQFQVIVGQAVDSIYKELTKQLSESSHENTEDTDKERLADQKTVKDKLRYVFNQVLGVITGSMMPIINILAASGIIKSILALLTGLDLISDTGNAYLLIDAMADAVFYFLPVLIGYNAAKKLNGNPILTAIIGGAIIYPSILEAADSEAMIFSLGALQFPFVSYTNSIFPMILGAWLVKISEDWLKQWVPTFIQAIFIPIVVIGFVTSVTFLFTGPVITWLSVGLANILQVLLRWNAPIFGGLIAGFYQILVIFGLHWGIIPIYVNDFAILGYSFLSAIVSTTIAPQGGAVLAVAVKSKKTSLKELGFAGAVSAFCGITEPAIYGINLRFKRPFICASIASAVGGFLTGLLEVNMWSIIGSVIGIPSYIDPDHGITANFWYALFITILTIAIAFVLTYVWGYNDQMKMAERKEKPAKPEASLNT